MSKSSIHIIPVKPTSEIHNRRLKDYDYVRKDLSSQNESWILEEIGEARKRIEEQYKKSTGQKMQSKSTPIREGVLLLNPEHSIEDLKVLSERLEAVFGIKTIQAYIHRDEGHFDSEKNWKTNLHAHMVFDWTDEKGKSIKLNRNRMSEMQDLVSEVLGMERGQRATVTGKKHLNPIEYKIQILEQDILEKKKEITHQENELSELKSLLNLEKDALEEISSKLSQKYAKIEFLKKNDTEKRRSQMEYLEAKKKYMMMKKYLI